MLCDFWDASDAVFLDFRRLSYKCVIVRSERNSKWTHNPFSASTSWNFSRLFPECYSRNKTSWVGEWSDETILIEPINITAEHPGNDETRKMSNNLNPLCLIWPWEKPKTTTTTTTKKEKKNQNPTDWNFHSLVHSCSENMSYQASYGTLIMHFRYRLKQI